MLLKKIIFLIVITSVLAWGSTKTQYKNECGICHGIDGTKEAMGRSKEIRGMSVKEIEKAMYDYASKTRPSMIMIQSMKKRFININSKEVLHDMAIYINNL